MNILNVKYSMYKKLLFILVLISVNFLLYYARLQIDDLVIILYYDLCKQTLYNVILDNKTKLGILSISFGDNLVLLETYFYHIYIANLTNLELFLNNMDLLTIIKSNKFNLEQINALILDTYLKHIMETEIIFNKSLQINITEAKYQAMEIIYRFIDDALILSNKECYLDMSYIETLLKELDFYNYTKTYDFQAKQFLMLKEFCHQKIFDSMANKNTGIPIRPRLDLESVVEILFQSSLLILFVETLMYTLTFLTDKFRFLIIKNIIFEKVIEILTLLAKKGYLINPNELHSLAEEITNLILLHYDPTNALNIIVPIAKIIVNSLKYKLDYIINN